MGHQAWLAAYLSKLDGNEVRCPECGAGTVNWRLAGDPATRLGYAILWCSRCGKGSHLSRVKFPKGIEFISMFDTNAVAQGVPEIRFIDED
jgi:ribosomal protein S27AE